MNLSYSNYMYIFMETLISYSLLEPWDRACLASSLLRILPAGDLGIVSIKETRRIFLYGATYKMKMVQF